VLLKLHGFHNHKMAQSFLCCIALYPEVPFKAKQRDVFIGSIESNVYGS